MKMKITLSILKKIRNHAFNSICKRKKKSGDVGINKKDKADGDFQGTALLRTRDNNFYGQWHDDHYLKYDY